MRITVFGTCRRFYNRYNLLRLLVLYVVDCDIAELFKTIDDARKKDDGALTSLTERNSSLSEGVKALTV